jgi:hypothetical protein
MFISLYNKPDWYEEIVPTKLVPAVSIRGRVVWESAAILKVGSGPAMLLTNHYKGTWCCSLMLC